MCEIQPIRFVHYMSHPKYPSELGVGCVCAGHMEGNYAAARDRERTVKNTYNRRRNWLTRKWKISAKGNPYLNTDGFNIAIFTQNKKWAVRITNVETSETVWGRKQYETLDQAKLAAFNGMICLKNGC